MVVHLFNGIAHYETREAVANIDERFHTIGDSDGRQYQLPPTVASLSRLFAPPSLAPLPPWPSSRGWGWGTAVPHPLQPPSHGCWKVWLLPHLTLLFQFQAFPSTFALVLQAGVEVWESWLYSHSNGEQEAEVTIQFVPWFGRWNWNAWKNLVCMDARVRENVMAFNVLVHQEHLDVNLILLFVFTLKHWLGLQC